MYYFVIVGSWWGPIEATSTLSSVADDRGFDLPRSFFHLDCSKALCRLGLTQYKHILWEKYAFDVLANKDKMQFSHYWICDSTSLFVCWPRGKVQVQLSYRNCFSPKIQKCEINQFGHKLYMLDLLSICQTSPCVHCIRTNQRVRRAQFLCISVGRVYIDGLLLLTLL